MVSRTWAPRRSPAAGSHTGTGPEGVGPEGLGASGPAALAADLQAILGSIRRSWRRQAGRPAELSSLTGAQLDLVRVVRRRPGLSITEAAEDLMVAPNTVSTLVSQLSEPGLLVRRVDESDRRVARLELSTGISRQADAWRDRRVVALGDAIGRLSAADQRRLADAVRVLTAVAEHLEAGGAER